MPDELHKALRAARGKLLRTRAAESAAVGAVVGGLGAAVLQAAWLLAGLSSGAASGLCLATAAAAMALASGAIRLGDVLGACRPAARAAGGVVALAALCGVGLLATGRVPYVAGWLWPVALLAGGGFAGALVTLVRGADVREAAAALDSRAGLAERLSTVAERPRPEAGEASAGGFLRRQALAAMRDRGADRLGLWTRTPATGGALGLVALVCGALALLPAAFTDGEAPLDTRPEGMISAPEPNDSAPGVALTRERFAGMSAASRQAFADALRNRAERSENPARAEALRRAAEAAERGDYEDMVARLREAGASETDLPSDLARVVPGETGPAAGEGDEPDGGTSGRAVEGAAPPGAPEAWRETRRRAEAALSSPGRVPPEYRNLVRAFYLGDGVGPPHAP